METSLTVDHHLVPLSLASKHSCLTSNPFTRSLLSGGCSLAKLPGRSCVNMPPKSFLRSAMVYLRASTSSPIWRKNQHKMVAQGSSTYSGCIAPFLWLALQADTSQAPWSPVPFSASSINHVVMCKCGLHPGSPIQTSTNGIAGCSRRGEICKVCPEVPIYFLKRKVLWENVLGWLKSSQLTESEDGEVLEQHSRNTESDLVIWWVNPDQNDLLLNADCGILYSNRLDVLLTD